jgi:hypothetical protein
VAVIQNWMNGRGLVELPCMPLVDGVTALPLERSVFFDSIAL